MSKRILTYSRLKEALSYDPATGIFTCLIHRRIARAGSVVGCLNGAGGYVVIGIDGTLHYAHRLAWLYMTGSWPAVLIDHRDGDRRNNAWSNLREANFSENMQNRLKPTKANKSGFLGVTWDKVTKSWRSAVTLNKKRHHLGRFKTAEEAHAAYIKAKREMHSHNNL